MKVFAQDTVTIPDSKTVMSNFKFSNLGDIASGALKYALVIAGLAMFAMLISGGFTLLTSVGNPDKIKQGTNKITFAIAGFLIVFASYWIIQIVELIFGFQIL